MVMCNKKTLVYSRIVGYHNPVTQWNKGKYEEFKERKSYVVHGFGSKSISGGND